MVLRNLIPEVTPVSTEQKSCLNRLPTQTGYTESNWAMPVSIVWKPIWDSIFRTFKRIHIDDMWFRNGRYVVDENLGRLVGISNHLNVTFPVAYHHFRSFLGETQWFSRWYHSHQLMTWAYSGQSGVYMAILKGEEDSTSQGQYLQFNQSSYLS